MKTLQEINSETTGRQRCEIYSRVNGYLRPVSNWNDAKQAEWEDRKAFKIKL